MVMYRVCGVCIVIVCLLSLCTIVSAARATVTTPIVLDMHVHVGG